MPIPKKMAIKSNFVYDQLRYIAQILLPALGTLYFALSNIWALPYSEEVVGTIVALDVFLGALLAVSTAAYNKSDARFDGEVEVFEDDATERYSLNLFGDPYEIKDKEVLTFKVSPVNDI